MRTTRFLSRSSLIALGVALALPAAAQDKPAAESGLTLEEVTVTARKIEENLMVVPLAITAITGKDLEAIGAKQLTDIMMVTPSFYFSNQQGASGRNDRTVNSLLFRGLYLDRNFGLSAGGQLFVDGAPVLGAAPPPLSDVERVEILKGPQSAYFGRSAFVGAIGFTTRDPSDEAGGKISLEGSRFGSHEANLSIEGPLGKKAAGRLSMRNFERGGYYNNAAVSGEELGAQTTNSISGTVVWKPTESVKVKAFGNFFIDSDGAVAQGALLQDNFNGRPQTDGSCPTFAQLPAGTPSAGNPNGGRSLYGYYCGTIPTIDQLPANILSGDYDVSPQATYNALFNGPPSWYTFNQNFKTKGGLRREAAQGNVRVDWDFGGGYTLTSISAYHQDKYQTILDLNYRSGRDRPNPFFASAAPPFGCAANPAVPNTAKCVPWLQALLLSQSFLKDWSQELRVTSPQDQRLRGMLGFNYFDGYSRGGTVVGILPIGPSFTAQKSVQTSKTPAVFGAINFDISDKVTVSAEARYQRDKIHQQALAVPQAGLPPTGVAALPLDAEFNSFSPRVSIDWEYAPNSILYALYSRGTRPGGFNAAFVTLPPAAIAELRSKVPDGKLGFEEEELENFEVGLKSTWLEGRARTTLTVYQDKWKNGQVGTTVPLASINNLVTVTTNQGLVDLDGVEFEGKFKVTRGFSVGATYALNKSEIKSYGTSPGAIAGACADCNNIYGSFAGVIGRPLPVVPKTTFTVNGEYDRPVNDNLSWFARADYMYQGAKYTDFAEVAQVGSRVNLNARIGLRTEKWTLEAFGTNLTDDKTMVSALGGIDVFTFLVAPTKNAIRISPPIPLSYGLRASFEF